MLENDYTLRLDHLQIAEFKVSPTYWIWKTNRLDQPKLPGNRSHS